MTNQTIAVTELRLSQDDYLHLIAALQMYMKSSKVDAENFDEVDGLYSHLKYQYPLRRSPAK